MDPLQYQQEAQVTLSHSFFGEFVETKAFIAALNDAIVAIAALDKIKKTLFYGRNLDVNVSARRRPFATLGSLKTSGAGETILHGLLGIVTESGEIAELLRDFIHAHLVDELPMFDVPHIREELGDLLWYVAVTGTAMETTLGEMMKVNIGKLRARYKQKFDAYEANNRNLSFETSIMNNLASAGKQAQAMLDVATPEPGPASLPRADDEAARYTAQVRDGMARDLLVQGQARSVPLRGSND